MPPSLHFRHSRVGRPRFLVSDTVALPRDLPCLCLLPPVLPGRPRLCRLGGSRAMFGVLPDKDFPPSSLSLVWLLLRGCPVPWCTGPATSALSTQACAWLRRFMMESNICGFPETASNSRRPVPFSRTKREVCVLGTWAAGGGRSSSSGSWKLNAAFWDCSTRCGWPRPGLLSMHLLISATSSRHLDPY
jgi:hypothetical protein